MQTKEAVSVAILGSGSPYLYLLLDAIRTGLPEKYVCSVRLFDAAPDKRAQAIRASELAGLGDQTVVTEDPASAIRGADMVIHTYRAGDSGYRLRQETAAAYHGVVAQETQGFAGIAHALENSQAATRYAPLITTECPDALNLVISNPTGLMTAYISDLGLRTVGLCELPFSLTKAARVVLSEPDLDLDYIGHNHFAYVLGAQSLRTSALSDFVTSPHTNLALLHEAGSIIETATPENISTALDWTRLAEAIGAIPNPYLTYYYAERSQLSRQNATGWIPRALDVDRVNSEISRALELGDLALLTKALRRRGGFLLGETLGQFVSAYFGGGDGCQMLLCSRQNSYRTRLGLSPEELAPEGPMWVKNRSIVSIGCPSTLDSHLSVMLATIAQFEVELLRACGSADDESRLRAMITHPLIRDPSIAHQLLKALRNRCSAHDPVAQG